MAKYSIDREAQLVFRYRVQCLQPSIGRSFLIEVIKKEGAAAAVSLMADLATKNRNAPLEIEDLSASHQALLTRATKTMNRRHFFEEALAFGVGISVLGDGIRHLPETGKPSEYTVANMLDKTPDGRDIVRGPVETATGAYLLAKCFGLASAEDIDDQMVAVTNAIRDLAAQYKRRDAGKELGR